ncbi:hypothetical protein SUGI_0152140 [Cryptomeria japonica]|nr:hypothetical protein SUGI_0152140 [Cryptomeria japonica]
MVDGPHNTVGIPKMGVSSPKECVVEGKSFEFFNDSEYDPGQDMGVNELEIVEPRAILQTVAKMINSEPSRKRTGKKTNKQKREEYALVKEKSSIKSYLTRSKGSTVSLGGLRWCGNMGLKDIDIEKDSKFVVESIISNYNGNWKFDPWIKSIKEILYNLNHTLSHVYREANQAADFLSKVVLDIVGSQITESSTVWNGFEAILECDRAISIRFGINRAGSFTSGIYFVL